MIELLVTILIWVLIGGLIWWLVSLIPLPPPFKQVALVILLLIGIILLIGLLYGSVPVFPVVRG
jgi:hypothetical protein